MQLAPADTKVKVKVAITDEPSLPTPADSEKSTIIIEAKSVDQDYIDGTKDVPSEKTHLISQSHISIRQQMWLPR